MNDLCNITFIGGSANLTQRVLRRADAECAYFDVAVMPDISEYQPGYEPHTVSARRERYLLRKVARSHFVAIYEYLSR